MVKFIHSDIFPKNPMLMCICGSSGSGKTHLLFKMLTTNGLLDYEKLYIYTTTPEQDYYKFLKGLEFLDKEIVKQLFLNYEENESDEEIENILEAAKNRFGEKDTGITVKITKLKTDLNLNNINKEKKNLVIFDDCVAQKDQSLQQEFFTKGRHHGCHCIYQTQTFYGLDSQFIRKNANCFIFFELNDKDVSQIIQSINHGMERYEFKNACKTIWNDSENQHGYVYVNIRKPAGQRVGTNIC